MDSAAKPALEDVRERARTFGIELMPSSEVHVLAGVRQLHEAVERVKRFVGEGDASKPHGC